jgi:hypothetical protein
VHFESPQVQFCFPATRAMNWITLIERLSKPENTVFKCHPPLAEQQLKHLETTLEVQLPQELKELYNLSNGLAEELAEIGPTGYVVLPADKMLAENQRLLLDPGSAVHGMLLVAPAYTGDYFGYLVRDKQITSTDIYVWNAAENRREWVAASLADFLVGWVSTEISA